MPRELEATLALLLVPVAAFCLWDFSYFSGAIAATIALALSTGLYIHSERGRP
jgi:hypothetical protein